MQLLQSIAQKFLILTPDEIQKWQDDSLEFFINQKEQANDIRGNFLRDKSNDLIAALGLRYGPMFEEFCTKIVGELQNEELKSSHVDSQIKKDAIYQILEIRLGDERNIEVEPLIKAIQEDLERE